MKSEEVHVAWLISHLGPYGVNSLRSGILKGYSANGNNLIVENIMMNDGRNNTEYRCVITDGMTILHQSNQTILNVAGEYHCIVYMYNAEQKQPRGC